MKNLLLLLVLGLAWFLPREAQAQTSFPASISLRVWEPITAKQLPSEIRRYRFNGLAMDMLMDRSLMYGRGKEFLDGVKDAIDKEPKNSTLLATYARTLIILKGTYLFNGKDAPERIGPRHSLDTNYIASLVQSAKENSRRPWLAYVADEELAIYRGVGKVSSFYNGRLQMARKSVSIERNPLTQTKLAEKLITAEAIENQPKGATQQGVALLVRITKAYPHYWRAKISLWQRYRYYPLARNKTKAEATYKSLLAVIPDHLENTKPVQRYLQWQHFDKRD